MNEEKKRKVEVRKSQVELLTSTHRHTHTQTQTHEVQQENPFKLYIHRLLYSYIPTQYYPFFCY